MIWIQRRTTVEFVQKTKGKCTRGLFIYVILCYFMLLYFIFYFCFCFRCPIVTVVTVVIVAFFVFLLFWLFYFIPYHLVLFCVFIFVCFLFRSLLFRGFKGSLTRAVREDNDFSSLTSGLPFSLPPPPLPCLNKARIAATFACELLFVACASTWQTNRKVNQNTFCYSYKNKNKSCRGYCCGPLRRAKVNSAFLSFSCRFIISYEEKYKNKVNFVFILIHYSYFTSRLVGLVEAPTTIKNSDFFLKILILTLFWN